MARAESRSVRQSEIVSIQHKEEHRKNIPTSEYEALLEDETKSAVRTAYKRRNRDLDPQLVWSGKDEQDVTDLYVHTPPIYIQEKIHPKSLIEDLQHESETRSIEDAPIPDLFADFNGLPNLQAKTEFYEHDQNWSNRMILGDSLQVMVSLAEREGLRGKVQCIYFDPPYGIKFNSNFQWSTTSHEVKDGNIKHITREPEQVKAFRDTWRNGIHSYLTYLRDRLTVARDLMSDSGSIFVQISDENVHRVRAVMDEVFGEDNFVSLITCRVTSGTSRDRKPKRVSDFLIWYGKNSENIKFRRLLLERELDTKTYTQVEEESGCRRPMTKQERNKQNPISDRCKAFRSLPLHSRGAGDHDPRFCFGSEWNIPLSSHWRHSLIGFQRLLAADRIKPDNTALSSVYYHNDYPATELETTWSDTGPEVSKNYVVQTSTKIIQRCILMTTDPGDLVLDPTCGSGTTAYVAEQWGRRWITIDTSRVSLALARTRIMGAKYPYYLLTDSREGQLKEAEVRQATPLQTPAYDRISHGFVYERVPQITLKSIAYNEKIDEIAAAYQSAADTALKGLNQALRGHKEEFIVTLGGRKGEAIKFNAPAKSIELLSGDTAFSDSLLEWEVPHHAPSDWGQEVKVALKHFWNVKTKRQKEINDCIAAQAEYKLLYDKPYQDNKKVRVAGPFTVESLSPHRSVSATSSDPNADEQPHDVIERHATDFSRAIPAADFSALILEQLKAAGVQQSDKNNKIDFTSLQGWAGDFICADGAYEQDGTQKRAGILIGPEHGTLGREDIVGAAREAAEQEFDVLIACAFNYDAQTTELSKLGKLPILKARMNADLQMSTDLKKTKSANLFVVFGEPDIELIDTSKTQIQVRICGIDIFDPRSGEVRSSEPEELACWFIDTNYDMERFFVRHAYFIGAGDPYKSLKTTLKTQINQDAWESLRSDISRPFARPQTGRIAVKAINHLGDEVMKVIRVNNDNC